MWGGTYQEKAREVAIETKTAWDRHNRSKVITRTYHTPIGSVSEKLQIRLDLSYNKQQWITEYMIKDVSDYRIVKFIIENTSYYEDYESFLETQGNTGDDGIVVADVKKSPMQEMLYTFMGMEKFFIDSYDHPREWKELAGLLEEKCNEVYKIVANSPAELVEAGENLSGDVISPRFFKKYSAPFYNKQAPIVT